MRRRIISSAWFLLSGLVSPVVGSLASAAPATGETRQTLQIYFIDVEAQTHRAMDNLSAVLAAAGLAMKDVVATTLYVADLKDFEAINRAYGSYFKSGAPSRSTVQVAGLPRGAKIEISAIAAKP